MKDFIPSDDFTQRVMGKVRVIAEKQSKLLSPHLTLWGYKSVRIMFPAAATLLGSWNLIRLYFAFFYPVICR